MATISDGPWVRADAHQCGSNCSTHQTKQQKRAAQQQKRGKK
jgi:hypothetical protein